MNAKQNSRQYPVDKIRLSLVSYQIMDMDKQTKQQEIPSSGFFMRKFTVCNFEETRYLCVNFFCQGDYNDDGDNDDVEEEEEEEGRESW